MRALRLNPKTINHKPYNLNLNQIAMKKKIIYILVFVCCLSLLSFAKQMGSSCLKKCEDKPARKKAAQAKVKKTASTDTRPFHFYLLNI